MPRISQYTTELPGSTSRLIGNVGSTTAGFDAGQLLGAVFTSQGQLLYAGSSKNSTFLNPPSSNAILSYSSGSSAPTWIVGSPGQIFYVSSAGLTTILVVPTSGAVLVYSTVNTSVGPRWEIPTSGSLLGASSVGLPTWIALGTSGQVLESTGGRPTWVAYPADPTTGHITTAGTSGQVLQTTAGAAAWINSTTIPGTIGSTIGTSGQILQSTGGVATWVTGTGTITTAGTSGQILQTTAGAATWINPSNVRHVIDVKDYGAVGDGVTNDNGPVSSAIAATTNGAVLYFPPGRYILTSAVAFTNQTVAIRGDSPKASVLQFSGTHGITWSSTNSTQAITIENLALETASSGTYNAIALTGFNAASNRELQCRIRDVYIRPVVMGANTDFWANGIVLTEIWNAVIEGVHIKGQATDDFSMTYGIQGAEQSVSIKIANCWFYDMNTGIYVASSCEGWVITNSDFVGVLSGVVWASAATLPQLQVEGCHVNSYFRGIDVTNNLTDGSVIDSLIFMNDSSTRAWQGVVVATSSCKNVRIVGNKIYGSGGVNGTAVGISISGNRCTILGNVINDQDTAVLLNAGATGNTVVGNTGSSNSTAITDNGTSNISTANAFN